MAPKMMMTTTICMLLVLAFATVASAEQSRVHEGETGTNFAVRKSFGGQPHILLGVGAREVTALRINVYGAGLYVGLKRAVPVWQQYLEGRFSKAGLVSNGTPDFSKLQNNAAARHFIVYGRFPKAMEMAFVRDSPAHRIVEAYEENWERLNLDRSKAGNGLTRFMEVIDHPISKGQRMVIRTNGNNLFITQPGVGTSKIKANHTFVTALWQVYFGNPCYQPSLRDELLSGLDRLHAVVEGS